MQGVAVGGYGGIVVYISGDSLAFLEWVAIGHTWMAWQWGVCIDSVAIRHV